MADLSDDDIRSIFNSVHGATALGSDFHFARAAIAADRALNAAQAAAEPVAWQQIGWAIRYEGEDPAEYALWKSRPTAEDIDDMERHGPGRIIVAPAFTGAPPQQAAPVAPTLYSRMEDGRYAEVQAEQAIERLLGVELLGIGFDDYDSSFEIYPMVDVVVTPDMHVAIMALGCQRYWVNFEDGTEIYSGGARKPSGTNRWQSFNEGEARKPRAPVASADVLDALMVFNRPKVGDEPWRETDFIAVTALPEFIHSVGRAWYGSVAPVAPAERAGW